MLCYLMIFLMFQYFALGSHQCRWNYNDQDDVRNVDSKMDEHDIPYDIIWLDIEHTDNKKYVFKVNVVAWAVTATPISLHLSSAYLTFIAYQQLLTIHNGFL